VAGYSPDGALATEAQLAYPAGLAVDQQGSLYIADSQNHLVRKVANGVISTFAHAVTPTGLAIDGLGSLYIADPNAGTITQIPSAGSPTVLNVLASDLTVGRDGYLYAVDGGTMFRVSFVGLSTVLAGGGDPAFGDNGPATLARLNHPSAVAVDSSGDIYIGGQTFGYDFPVSPNAFIPQCPGVPCEAGSGFISELNPNAAPANQLVYGTYLGGTSSIGYEAVTGLGVDSNGEIYAAGHTLSADFPVTPDAAQPTCLSCPGALQGEGSDGFLTVLNPAASGASQLVYSTFLGGNNYDAATGLAMGPTGLVAVAGYSSSTDFPTTSNALKLQCPACRNTGSLGSNRDAFVSVFQF